MVSACLLDVILHLTNQLFLYFLIQKQYPHHIFKKRSDFIHYYIMSQLLLFHDTKLESVSDINAPVVTKPYYTIVLSIRQNKTLVNHKSYSFIAKFDLVKTFYF